MKTATNLLILKIIKNGGVVCVVIISIKRVEKVLLNYIFSKLENFLHKLHFYV